MTDMKAMKARKIAVVVGGPSTEAEVSRRTGKAVTDALRKKGYQAEIVELVPAELAATLQDKRFDIVFNALHGQYGEDGVLQGMCEMMNIPYTGPGVMASAVGMNKIISKSAFRGAGISTAPFAYYFIEQGLDEIAADMGREFPLPVVIKSAAPHDGTDNVGYCIEIDGKVFSFLTDLGEITPTAAHYISKAHYLILEANYDEEMLKMGPYPQYLKERIASKTGHMSNSDTAEFLAENITEHLRYIWLCHLSKDNNHPELAYKTVEWKLKNKGILVGKDVQLLALKRNTPSELYVFE